MKTEFSELEPSHQHNSILPVVETAHLRESQLHHLKTPQYNTKWQWPRWSSPELYSIPSLTNSTLKCHDNYSTHSHDEDEGTVHSYFTHIEDEESTINDLSVDQKNEVETKREAVITLCKLLMLYGAPCHRIEEALGDASESLSVKATFIFIPSIMMITFLNDNNNNNKEEYKGGINNGCTHPETMLIRCPQGFDMGKLSQVNDIIQGICRKEVTAIQSTKMMKELLSSKPPTWSPWVTLLSHATSALLTAPVMFNGSLIDTALSGGLGLLVGLLIILSERYSSYCNIFEISTTILIGFITKALDRWICFTGVVLSATSILIPGYTLTMSIMELSARHVITGTVRFVYAMIYALFIGYGLEVGTSIYEAVDARSSPAQFDACTGNVPPWLYTVLFPVMAISMSINLGASVRQWPSMVCCSAVGFGVSVITSKVISNFQIVGTISAFSVGLFGNLYFKITGELALVPLSCGIVSLVPGSVGIQGAYFLIRQDDQGVSFATQMVVASLGISVGLFAATLAVSPNEHSKKSAYLSY